LKHICRDTQSRQSIYRECDPCVESYVEFVTTGVPIDDALVFCSGWEVEQKEFEKDGVTKTVRSTAKSLNE
jgi:hypothetical protein